MKLAFLKRTRRCGPEEYLVNTIVALGISGFFPLDQRGGLFFQVLYTCAILAITTGRLSDAGVSRLWAFMMLPTLAAPWLCPLLIPGARPSSALAQFFESIFVVHSGTLSVLALALLAVPITIGLLPTRRLEPEESTELQATPAAQQ